jgi:hypothetical protein
VAIVAAIGLTGCASQAGAPAPSYGGWPTFLPSPTNDGDQTLTGSTASPAITIEGDSVLAQLSTGGTVVITVAGPAMPDENDPSPLPTIDCTWTVTLTKATVPVPITASQFALTDSAGGTHRPTFAAGSADATVQPGDTATFQITTVMPDGEGILQWAPDSHNPVATWDFVVEDD